jgi:hypothetical protein
MRWLTESGRSIDYINHAGNRAVYTVEPIHTGVGGQLIRRSLAHQAQFLVNMAMSMV